MTLFKAFRLTVNFLLITSLFVIIVQNTRSANIDILFWETHAPLSLMIMGAALVGAGIVLFSVILKRKPKRGR